MNSSRIELMEILGGQFCKNCGFNDERVLQIDHIFGNGQDMPLTVKGIILYYLENPNIAREELQVLCANCHRIKSLENGEIGRKKITQKKHERLEVRKHIPQNNLKNMDWYK